MTFSNIYRLKTDSQWLSKLSNGLMLLQHVPILSVSVHVSFFSNLIFGHLIFSDQPLCFFPTGCYPFSDQDPFILLRSPHVYFIGNQPKFETKLVKSDDGHEKVRVILLPNFRDTGEVVLVNTKSLECQVRRFVV